MKVIYLVGDAPPHTDYSDGYDYTRAARAAAGKGIQLHTILCGDRPRGREAWRKIASLGGGQFMTIHQDGGMREEHSRYDDELARLHDKLRDTAIGYGAAAPRGRRGDARGGGGAGVGQGGARELHGQEAARRSAARATWSSRSRAVRSSWTTSRTSCRRR